MDFDRDTISDALAHAACRRCGSVGATISFVLDGPHFARVDCYRCGAWIDWVKFPTAEPRRDRRSSRKKLRDLGDRCELCLRHAAELPPRERLEVHHVLEVAADSGGDDVPNLRAYCSACHALVGWLRTYFGHRSAVAE